MKLPRWVQSVTIEGVGYCIRSVAHLFFQISDVLWKPKCLIGVAKRQDQAPEASGFHIASGFSYNGHANAAHAAAVT